MKAEVDWPRVRDYYEAGHSREECQKMFGFSDWDWHAAAGRGDIEPRGSVRRASERRALIGRLRAEGLSYQAISRRLGVSKATVAYHVRRMGVPADDRCGRRYDWGQVQDAVDEGLSVSKCEARFGLVASLEVV